MRRVCRDEISLAVLRQFGNVYHIQRVITYIRTVGPMFISGIGYVIYRSDRTYWTNGQDS